MWHDPALGAERAAWRRRGGEGKATPNRAGKRLPKDLRDVRDALLRAIGAVEAGTLEPQRASAMGTLARALIAVHSTTALEDRLTELERMVAEESALARAPRR